jgi:hypothetical protein
MCSVFDQVMGTGFFFDIVRLKHAVMTGAQQTATIKLYSNITDFAWQNINLQQSFIYEK